MSARRVQTSPGIAAATGVPEPTVAKVLKALTSAGLVASQRGARGGYRLLARWRQIAIADVIAAIDGPIALTACVDGATDAAARSQGLCAVKGRWDLVNDAIRGRSAASPWPTCARPRSRRCSASPTPRPLAVAPLAE